MGQDRFSQMNQIRIWLIVIIVVSAVALVVFLFMMLRLRNKRKKELAYFNKKLHQTVRNDILEKAINNYHKPGNRVYWLIRVVEFNQFGETDHFFNLNEGDVTIGRDFGSNKYCVFDEEIDKNQCKIVFNKEIPGLMNLTERQKTIFTPGQKRGRSLKKNHVMREGETIRLFTGDSVSFGDTKLVFHVFNNNSGIV